MNYFTRTEAIAWFIVKILVTLAGAYILMNVDWVGESVAIALIIALVLLPLVAFGELIHMIYQKVKKRTN